MVAALVGALARAGSYNLDMSRATSDGPRDEGHGVAPAPLDGHGGHGGLAFAQGCLHCLYDLRGLSPDGNCPECGSPIAGSHVARLCNADPDWLNRVANGAGLILLGIIVGPIALIMMLAPSPLLLIAPLLLSFPAAGAFYFTSPEPATWRHSVSGRLVRALLGASIVLLGTLPVRLLANPDGLDIPWLAIACVAATIATAVAILAHVNWLMRRIPARRLALCARTLAWIVTGGVAMVLLAVLIDARASMAWSPGSTIGAVGVPGALLLLTAAIGSFALFVSVTRELSRAAADASRLQKARQGGTTASTIDGS